MAELRNRGGAPIDGGAIEDFASGIAGNVTRPADPDYDTARKIGNASIEKRPEPR